MQCSTIVENAKKIYPRNKMNANKIKSRDKSHCDFTQSLRFIIAHRQLLTKLLSRDGNRCDFYKIAVIPKNRSDLYKSQLNDHNTLHYGDYSAILSQHISILSFARIQSLWCRIFVAVFYAVQ